MRNANASPPVQDRRTLVRKVAVVLLALAGAGCARPAPTRASDVAAPAATLHAARIDDRGGFAEPRLAATVQVPAGWRTFGGVGWNDRANCAANRLQLAWSALSEDGLSAVELLPGLYWQVDGMQDMDSGCPFLPYRTARAFLEAMAARWRPHARLLDYRDLPQVDEAARQALLQKLGPDAVPQGVEWRHESGRVLLGFAQDGVQMREVLTATVLFTRNGDALYGGVGAMFAQRAPAGRLDFAMGDTIRESIRPDPDWERAVSQRPAPVQGPDRGERLLLRNDTSYREIAVRELRGETDRAAARLRAASPASLVAAAPTADADRLPGAAQSAAAPAESAAPEYSPFASFERGKQPSRPDIGLRPLPDSLPEGWQADAADFGCWHASRLCAAAVAHAVAADAWLEAWPPQRGATVRGQGVPAVRTAEAWLGDWVGRHYPDADGLQVHMLDAQTASPLVVVAFAATSPAGVPHRVWLATRVTAGYRGDARRAQSLPVLALHAADPDFDEASAQALLARLRFDPVDEARWWQGYERYQLSDCRPRPDGLCQDTHPYHGDFQSMDSMGVWDHRAGDDGY